MSAIKSGPRGQPDVPNLVPVMRNPQILRLVNETAVRTGESPEAVIETALLERLERLPPDIPATSGEHPDMTEEERWERVTAIVQEMQRRYKESGVKLPDHADLLYDENGLPREGEIIYGSDGIAR